jgi:heat-inducible transcriptional repressor
MSGEEEEIHVLMGEELGQRLGGPYSFVYTHYETPMHGAGDIGVIGPVRLNYAFVVPTVRYFGDLIESIAKGW